MNSFIETHAEERPMHNTIAMAGRTLGPGHPCFITYEAGPTHTGLESAKKLAAEAACAGADAVKFQIVDPDRLVADKKQLFTYKILADRETGRLEEVSEPLYDILCRRALSVPEWRELKAHCDGLGLAFFATACFFEDVDLLAELGADSVKIASADITHFPLLRHAAKSGMSVQIDTGNATFGEIEEAYRMLTGECGAQVIIHHCPGGYPADPANINLRVLTSLRAMFDCPVAYSDHSPGWDMDIAALSLGANLLEKTISLDRTTRSTEHAFSLEPTDMADFVRAVRNVELAMGQTWKALTPAELKGRMAVRRSCFLKRDKAAGEPLEREDVEFRRPGFGLSPRELDEAEGRALARDLPAGHMLTLKDLDA